MSIRAAALHELGGGAPPGGATFSLRGPLLPGGAGRPPVEDALEEAPAAGGATDSTTLPALGSCEIEATGSGSVIGTATSLLLSSAAQNVARGKKN